MADTIVAPQTTTPATSTTQTNQSQNLLAHIKSTSDAMDKGDVLGSAMGVANVAMDVIGIVGDPMGAITSAGVGWVLNAVSFLREPFDILKGDPSAITGSSQSWLSAAKSLTATAEKYRAAATTQTRSWTGTASDGYRAASNSQADGLEALAKASQSVSSAITQAGKAVAEGRKIVMDLISEAVSKIIQICIEALSSSWLSFGASIAAGIAQSVQKAVSTAQKLVQKIQKVVQTLQKIIQFVQKVIQIVQQVKQLLDTIGGKATGVPNAQPTSTQVPYSVDSTGHDPNNVTATTPQAAPIAPGYQWQPVKNVGENTTQPAQATPAVQPGGGQQPVRRPPQVRPQPTGQQGRVSQNGWPVNPPRSAHTIPGTNVRVTVADGPAGDVLMHVLGQVNSRVEDISMNSDRNERDDWGYADRSVRGSEAVSNHASGTAVDMNATRHALGAQNTFTPAQVQEIHRILAETDNVVRWGGDYTGRRDEMHFEIVGSQEEVARVAERLRQAQQTPR
jgi:uncharacterized protein YukE